AIDSALLNQASGERAAVWDWLSGQPQTDPIKALKLEVLKTTGFQDPDLAMKLVADLPQSSEGDAQVKELARCLINGGMAIHRFDNLMDQAPERLRQPLLQAAFNNFRTDMASFDPQVWVDRLPQVESSARTQATESLARSWAALAPEDAVDWVSSLSP